MYLSLKLLKEYVSLPKSLTAQDIANALTMHTVEVEGVFEQAKKYEKVVVGQILEVKKHPNADRLQIAQVNVGKEKLSIVCGAPNIEAGQKVPVALIGAVLPNGMEIKEAKVRGELSYGMLCAEDELALGDDHSGIMILDEKAKIGQNLADYLELDDVVFEVDNKSLSNRADLWGHIGLSRELSAIFDAPFNDYIYDKEIFNSEAKEKIKVKNEEAKLCPRYMAIRVDGIEIKSSPKWMQEKLLATGLRPINNIVDITNYVMIEMGQPMHAFDADKVDKIVVRRAKKNEKIITLDNEERELSDEMLVIADSKKPIAIAGVMGGLESEVGVDTKSIIFESANFDYGNIRQTSSALALRSDSSMRYEKALDPNLTEKALARALDLLKQICPEAKISSQLVDLSDFDLNLGPIEISKEWLVNSIGKSFALELEKDDKIINKILTKLGFEIEEQDEKMLITIPTWRAGRDVSAKEDIVEEVARIFGFDKIKEEMPKLEILPPKENKERDLIYKIKEILIGAPALSEVYNYSFVGEEQLNKLCIDFSSHIKLANPINKNHTMLRQNLAPNLIEVVKNNQARFKEIKVFEIGKIFMPMDSEYRKDLSGEEKIPFQENKLGIVCAFDNLDEAWDECKGVVVHLLEKLGLELTFNFFESKLGWMDKNMSAEIFIDEFSIGVVSAVSAKASKKTNLKKATVIAELRIKDLLKVYEEEGGKKYKAIDKFPSLRRDLAFVVDEKITYNDIRKTIFDFSEYIKKVELFDVYRGEKLGRGKKNLAFKIEYQADRTMRAEEIDDLREKLLKTMQEKFDAKIRDF